MDEQQMRAACARIAAEWHAGGLAGGSIYEDFAVELAKVVQAAEREKWALHLDAIAARRDADDPHARALRWIAAEMRA